MKIIVFCLFVALAAWTQSTAEPLPVTDAEKIADALRAGPNFITDEAAIVDYPASKGGEFRILRKGTSEWTCLPGPPPGSKHDDPGCFNRVFFQNDILYSLSSSADYDPQPGLIAIKTKVYALNFADDEFNPAELHVLEELMPRVRKGRFIVQPGSAESFGHLTMVHPVLWSEHVAEFLRSLGNKPLQSSIGK